MSSTRPKRCACQDKSSNKIQFSNPCCKEIALGTGRTLNIGALQFDPVALNQLQTLGVPLVEQSQRIALYNTFFSACIQKYVAAITRLRMCCSLCSQKKKEDEYEDDCDKNLQQCPPCCKATIVALGEIITGLCQYGFNAAVTFGVTVSSPAGPADLQTILNNLLATADVAFAFVLNNLGC